MHDVFHISVLRKSTPYPTCLINLQDIHVNKDTSYSKEPLQILEVEEHKFKNKVISVVKV